MPRHAVGPTHIAYASHPFAHGGHHAPAYGLLQPASASPVETHPSLGPRRGAPSPILPPSPQLARRHSRKSGSFGRSVEAGFDELLDFGSEFGASIGVLGDKLGRTVPGVRGSVAFLSTLRSNIRLSSDIGPPSPSLHPLASPPLSPLPASYRGSPLLTVSATGPALSPPLLGSLPAAAPLPKLVFEAPDSVQSRVDALQLVVDSVVQQQQVVTTKVLRSEVSYAAAVSAAVALFLNLYREQADLLIIGAALATGAALAALAVRWLARGYMTQAAAVDWDWLGDDELLVARLGDEVVGAAAYRVATADAKTAPAPPAGRRNRRRSSVTRVGVVRAWTVRRRDRGHGAGRALLEAAARACLKDRRCGNVVVADDGERAGARRELPLWLAQATGVDDMLAGDVKRAAKTLEGIVAGLLG